MRIEQHVATQHLVINFTEPEFDLIIPLMGTSEGALYLTEVLARYIGRGEVGITGYRVDQVNKILELSLSYPMPQASFNVKTTVSIEEVR